MKQEKKASNKNRFVTGLIIILTSIIVVEIHLSNIVTFFSLLLFLFGVYLLITHSKEVTQ